MPLHLRWTGSSDLDTVALTRLRCYAKSAGELANFKDRIRDDPRSGDGDFLLAEDDGRPVGTATHLSLTMHVRGATVAAGVAWVGAVRTARRRAGGGVATAVMAEVVRHARDRGDVVSALMPFRASYYEHFGYGVVERRNDWTVPLAVLPRGDFDGVRSFEPADFDARSDCLRLVNNSGQCDFDWSDDYWRSVDKSPGDGFELIDRGGDGPARGSMFLAHEIIGGRDVAKVTRMIHDGPDSLRRQLHFLSSLKDQYAAAAITLPADVRLNWLLNETQIPHRPVNHPVAECRPYTRMQVRILDHRKFLQSVRWPKATQGSATIAVHECEGSASRFDLDVHGGRAACGDATNAADFECPDRVWAAVACGDLTATAAVQWGLATGSAAACGLLDALAAGPAPFSHLYF